MVEPHLAAWQASHGPSFASTLVADYMLRAAEAREARGFPSTRDAHRIAVYEGIEI